MNSKGFTLVEVLLAITVLGIAMVGILPSFQVFMDTNSATESYSSAMAAGQQVMESFRHQDLATLPTSGQSAVSVITIGQHTFDVVAEYCAVPSYCGTGSRHIIVEVTHGGQMLYQLETVFTNLR